MTICTYLTVHRLEGTVLVQSSRYTAVLLLIVITGHHIIMDEKESNSKNHQNSNIFLKLKFFEDVIENDVKYFFQYKCYYSILYSKSWTLHSNLGRGKKISYIYNYLDFY